MRKFYFAYPISMTNDEVDIYQAAFDVYSSSAGTMKASITVFQGVDIAVPPSLTAYDTARSLQARQQVIDTLETSSYWEDVSAADSLALLVTAAYNGGLTYVGLGNLGISITVTLVFSDGSYQDYLWNLATNTLTYIVDSSRTAQGQLIPEANSQEYAGTWQGSTAELHNHMGQLGAITSFGTCSTTSGLVSCSWTDATNTLTCQIRYSCN